MVQSEVIYHGLCYITTMEMERSEQREITHKMGDYSRLGAKMQSFILTLI